MKQQFTYFGYNNMHGRFYYLVFSIVSICYFAGSCGQSPALPSKNSLTQTEKLARFRQHFWDSLPQPTSWVTDLDGIYTNIEKQRLDSILTDFEKKTSFEIAIITLDTMCSDKERLNDLSLHIARTWKIGKPDKENGILIAISNGYRKMRIQNANGVRQIVSDSATQEIIENYFVPQFVKNRFFAGTVEGLNELMKQLKSADKTK